MVSWHVHEKAIMTAIIPLALISTLSKSNARLFLRTSVIGVVGLFPLIFRPVELMFKVFGCVSYFALATYLFEHECSFSRIITRKDLFAIFLLIIVLLFLEIIHPLFFKPREQMEFLPLMMVSVICAIGLIMSWIDAGKLMFRSEAKISEYDFSKRENKDKTK